jgi:hypothetical protein
MTLPTALQMVVTTSCVEGQFIGIMQDEATPFKGMAMLASKPSCSQKCYIASCIDGIRTLQRHQELGG